jgi:hypothetical protein
MWRRLSYVAALALVTVLLAVPAEGAAGRDGAAEKPVRYTVYAGYGSSAGRSEDAWNRYYDSTGGNFLIGLVRPIAPHLYVSVEGHYSSFAFDHVAFRAENGIATGEPVDGSPAKLFVGAVGICVAKPLGAAVTPRVRVALALASLDEEYKYSNLTPGPVLPSGTSISKSGSTQLYGSQVDGNLRFLPRSVAGPFVEIGYLWLSGGGLEPRIVLLRFGISLDLR